MTAGLESAKVTVPDAGPRTVGEADTWAGVVATTDGAGHAAGGLPVPHALDATRATSASTGAGDQCMTAYRKRKPVSGIVGMGIFCEKR